MKRVFVYSNRVKQSLQLKRDITKALKENGFQISSDDPEVILVIGGDGTMLSSVRNFLDKEVPFLGINTGNLGFLAGIRSEDLKDLPSILEEESFRVEEFPLLEVTATTLKNEKITSYCFNDVIIKHLMPRVMEALIFVNNRPFNYFTGDGFIISTPVGTTGYAIWAGGAAIDHQLDAYQLTPLVPNDSRINRPLKHSMVIPMSTRLDFRIVKAYKREVSLSCDGKTLTGNYVSHITVKASSRKVKVIRHQDSTYYTLFRNKIIDKSIHRILEDRNEGTF